MGETRTVQQMVTIEQRVSDIGPCMLIPNSRLGISLTHGTLHIVPQPSVMKPLSDAVGGKPIEPDLEHYARLAPVVDAAAE